MLKHRIHSTLINFGRPARSPTCSGSRGAGCSSAAGPEPWRQTSAPRSSDRRPRGPDRSDQQAPAGGPRRPPLHPAPDERPGIGWVLAFTIGAEIGEIERFSPREAHRLHRALPARRPVGRFRPPRPADQARAPLPALGAARGDHARAQAPRLPERYQRNKRRLGKQRGAGRADRHRPPARPPIWHMLSRGEKFAPRGAALRLAA